MSNDHESVRNILNFTVLRSDFKNWVLYEQSIEPIEFNKKTLFDKLVPIIQFSKSLVDQFEVELAEHDQNVDLVKVGECITKFIDQMRMDYAQYTKNHNDIAEQVKKVCQLSTFETLWL